MWGGVIKLAYCGTLGHSYDIGCVIEAIRELNAESRNWIYFIVMGAGPKQEEFVRQAKDLPVIFTGRLLYPEMVWVLSHCDIAVNPISKGAAQSIINKHMDYAMAGLPVINTEESLEYRGMIEKYNCGINCRCENVEDVKNAIETLMYNPGQRILMGKNSRRMAEELFDRAVTYVKTKQLILNGET